LQGGAFIVPFADKAFDENGQLIDENQQESLKLLMSRLRKEISFVNQ
jgi:hypothetical protein